MELAFVNLVLVLFDPETSLSARPLRRHGYSDGNGVLYGSLPTLRCWWPIIIITLHSTQIRLFLVPAPSCEWFILPSKRRNEISPLTIKVHF